MKNRWEPRRRATRLLMLWAMVGIGAVSFVAERPARAAEQIPPAATKEADEIFKARCALCHGPGGKGDGPTAAALNPKPRNLTDAAWQKSVADAHIETIVLNGGPSVGKSPLMPPNPDLSGKPDVVKALRQIVRHFGQAS